jgi:hypothetical protein
MRSPHGYFISVDPAASTSQENDIMSCAHAYCGNGNGSIHMVKSSLTGKLEVMVFRADGSHYFKECGYCRSCMAPVCPICDGKPCNNRHRRMEAMEELHHKLTLRCT